MSFVVYKMLRTALPISFGFLKTEYLNCDSYVVPKTLFDSAENHPDRVALGSGNALTSRYVLERHSLLGSGTQSPGLVRRQRGTKHDGTHAFPGLLEQFCFTMCASAAAVTSVSMSH